MGLILANQLGDTIYNTFVNIFTSIGQSIGNNVVVAVLTFSILLALIIYRVIRNRYTTEVLTYKAISKINDYFSKHPFITEENLVEFNRLMMKCPKTIRFQWQRYIVNRDKKPSDFLNEENCITRPLRTNSYKQGLKNFTISSVLLCVLSAAFIIGSFINIDAQVGTVLVGLITPGIAVLISCIYLLFGNILYNAIMNDLYYSYTNFEKAIDRAVVEMPEAIDYEIIFTSKEIQNGIPALQEFLEQRALYEQEQIRRAQESEVVHDVYDFSELEVDGRVVMEKAMNESEQYLGNRSRLEQEISGIQSEQDVLLKEYEEKNKMSQRNLRDIREQIAKLKTKIETASNEIHRSNHRREQAAEIEKEQNLEKQIAKDTKEFEKKYSDLEQEKEKKRSEIEEGKNKATKVLVEEFKAFTNKTHKDLKEIAENEVKEKLEALTNEKNELSVILEEKDKLMAEKMALYEDKVASLESLEQEIDQHNDSLEELKQQIEALNNELEERNNEIFEVKQELESRKLEINSKDEIIENLKNQAQTEVYRYFDANGNEFYFDENDNPYYLDAEGNAVYYESEETPVEETAEIENIGVEKVKETSETDEDIKEEASEVKEDIKPKKERKSGKKVSKEVFETKAINEEPKADIQESEKDDSIETTLNKLAKAAEEKMKEDAKKKTRKTTSAKKSPTSKKTTNNKKSSTTKKTTTSKKVSNKKKK